MAQGKRIRFTDNLVGKKFGRLTVIAAGPRCPYHPNTAWICRCDCGNTIRIFRARLMSGNVSCGCARHRHGKCGTSVYNRWCEIIARCTRPKCTSYRNYGKRGITVCDKWRNFENFYTDMGDPPTAQHSIDRIDNNGPYSPENCRWATRAEQQRNTRRNHIIVFNGESLCIGDWCVRFNLNRNTLQKRLKDGWKIEKALKTPQPRNPNHGRKIEFNGEAHTAAEWSRKIGVPRKVIERRMRDGWPVHIVLGPLMRNRNK